MEIMMYKNNFVVVVKCNGRILRERNGNVMLPFGSEYSILLKNLDSRRAVVKVDVDGENVLDNDRIIVPAYNTVELKGKMKSGKVRHTFKFIEKTEEISNHRGDRADDGLIRVECWFEKPPVTWIYYQEPLYQFPVQPLVKRSGGDYWSSSEMTTGGMIGASNVNFCCNVSASASTGKDGITVQGSKTNQDFSYDTVGALETSSHVIVIQLRGFSKKNRVTRPVTVRTRFRCPTCGRRSKSFAKWCHNCGTNLEL